MEYEREMKNTGLVTRPNCLVGVGASAGGLEALQQFLTFLPSNTGMAFVIIQHLAPDHKSLLTEILGKYTNMKVVEIEDGMKLEKNHVYMIPPRFDVEVQGDILRLHEYNTQLINHPIDIFFRSMAFSFGNRSVAVILSGTGSDGTNGIRFIKDQNGMIIVQSPESAKFDGMPRNAIATGFADLVQNPESIAREMAHIASSMVDDSAKLKLSDQDLMAQIFSILRNVTNINYTYYKQTTILRRIERRLVITHNPNLQAYVNYLNNNPDEAKLLAKEVLIGVTSFFRDSDYFDVLKENVIKQILKEAPQSKQIRVWVAGCSTGEEAYSIAILFLEAMEELNIHRKVKIFATDLDSDAIATAMKGTYGDNIIEDVSISRLSRFFVRKGNKYQVRRNVRQMIIFAKHNVFQDPPFGKLDLISCRNVLIYFQTVLQKNLFSIFHRALNDHGYLFLGKSESVTDYDDVFRTVCPNEKIFIHNVSGKAPAHEELGYSLQSIETNLEPVADQGTEEESEEQVASNELNTSILENLMPATALLDGKNELIRTYGDCSKFLSIPVGLATLDIFMLLRSDLKIAVSTALRESRSKKARVAYDKVPFQSDGKEEYITLVAQPVFDQNGRNTNYTAIVFIQGNQEVSGEVKDFKIDTAASERIANLETELRGTRDKLKQAVSELESVNAELQAANEELLTSNEELQSSNEELQSVNEELYTVNSEYQAKVKELGDLNDDMANFLSTTLIGIIMVDKNLNIRKFTEYIASEFNIGEQDVGRSLKYLTFSFATVDLLNQCRQVLETEEAMEEHCASTSGKTYLIRIAPYRSHITDPDTGKNTDGQIQGLVLTFVDTTKQIDDQEQVEELSRALRKAVEEGREKESFLSHMSHDMRTPLTAILGLTQLDLQKPDLPEDLAEDLGKVEASSKYLLGLIEEILETSQIHAGKIVSVSSAIREKTIVDNIEKVMAVQMKQMGRDFQIQVTGSVNRVVMADAKHLERVLVNLLQNSLKYTKKGGHIRLGVNVRYAGSTARYTFTVRDDGVGMSKDFQKRMYLPFEQEGKNPNGGEGGNGLGLYIVKTLTSIMDGDISCISEEGHGTEFILHFTFPLATDEQVRLASYHAETYEEQVLYGKNVLLVEDNRINAEVIMKILKTKGIHYELATDGQEALDLFRTQGAYHFQAILMDLMMPVMDGKECTREIRNLNQEDAKTIPVLALTADASQGTEESCLRAGMDGYIEKPIEPDHLFYKLAEAFERRDTADGQ